MFHGILKVAFLLGLAAYLCLLLAPRKRRYRQGRIAESYESTYHKALMIANVSGMMLLPTLYALTRWFDFADYGLPTWAGLIGMVVWSATLWLLWRSHADLGRNWSPTVDLREGHSLVTEGVYRHIRHPIYAAHWLWAIAQALMLQNWIVGLAGLVSFSPIYLLRVPLEEQMMLRQFGEAYRSYMDRTGRVFPRLRH